MPFTEGTTEHLARNAERENPYLSQVDRQRLEAAYEGCYPYEARIAGATADIAGRDATCRAYFQGDLNGMRQATDGKCGDGTFNNLVAKAREARQYDAAGMPALAEARAREAESMAACVRAEEGRA